MESVEKTWQEQAAESDLADDYLDHGVIALEGIDERRYRSQIAPDLPLLVYLRTFPRPGWDLWHHRQQRI